MDSSDNINTLQKSDHVHSKKEDIELTDLILDTNTCDDLVNIHKMNYLVLGILLFILLSLPQTIDGIKHVVPIANIPGVCILIQILLFSLVYFVISNKYFI